MVLIEAPATRSEIADTVEDPTHYGTIRGRTRPGSNSESESDPGNLFDEMVAEGVMPGASGHPGSIPDFAPQDDENSDSPGGKAPGEGATGGQLVGGQLVDGQLVDEAWTSKLAQQRRRWLLAGIALVAGILLAMMAFMIVAGRGAKPVAQPPPATNPVASESPAESTSAAASSRLDTADSDSPVATDPSPSAAGIAPVPDEPQPATPPADPPVVTPPTPSAIPTVVTPPATYGTAPERPPADLLPQDAEIVKADRMVPGGALTDTLRRLGGLFDDGEVTVETSPDRGTSMPADSPAGAAATDPTVPPLPRPAPRAVDVPSRLADPIVQIEFSGMPLRDFLQFVTVYSTIPVSLDPDVLIWLGLTPDTPITLKLANTTVAELLESALGKIGLAAIPSDEQIFVTRKPRVDEAASRTARRRVDDLVGFDPQQSDHLRSLLTSLIEPDSWSEVGGPGTVTIENGILQIRQSEQPLIETSALLERLRVARGLPKQSKFDEKWFLPVSRTSRAAPALAKSVTLNYARPTSFPKVVRRLSSESGVAILMDWNALASVGWSPDAETVLTVTAQPLRNALTTLLSPMNLTYRIVDESLFQITTPAALEGRAEIEFYPVGELLGEANDVDAFLRRLRESVPPEWLSGTGGSGLLKFDLPSRCLVALLPQPRQQVVEQRLRDWKTTRK